MQRGFAFHLDQRLHSKLTEPDGSPTREVEGINREHGADDPRGTKTVAAPATVSESSFIVAPRRQPLRALRGKADERFLSASQETCRQIRSNVTGGDARNRSKP